MQGRLAVAIPESVNSASRGIPSDSRVETGARAPDNQGVHMLIIGLVVIAAAATFGIEIASMNNVSIDIDAFNQVYETSAALVFAAGVVTALVGAIGVLLVRDGLVRLRSTRRDVREAEVRRERHLAALEEEHAAYHTTDGPAPAVDTLDLRDELERNRQREHVTTF